VGQQLQVKYEQNDRVWLYCINKTQCTVITVHDTNKVTGGHIIG